MNYRIGNRSVVSMSSHCECWLYRVYMTVMEYEELVSILTNIPGLTLASGKLGT